jgi:hypothetical protein
VLGPLLADGDLFSRICMRKAEGRYFTEDEVMDTFIQVRAGTLQSMHMLLYMLPQAVTALATPLRHM